MDPGKADGENPPCQVMKDSKNNGLFQKKKAYVGGIPGPIRVESEGFIGGPS